MSSDSHIRQISGGSKIQWRREKWARALTESIFVDSFNYVWQIYIPNLGYLILPKCQAPPPPTAILTSIRPKLNELASARYTYGIPVAHLKIGGECHQSVMHRWQKIFHFLLLLLASIYHFFWTRTISLVPEFMCRAKLFLKNWSF